MLLRISIVVLLCMLFVVSVCDARQLGYHTDDASSPQQPTIIEKHITTTPQNITVISASDYDYIMMFIKDRDGQHNILKFDNMVHCVKSAKITGRTLRIWNYKIKCIDYKRNICLNGDNDKC